MPLLSLSKDCFKFKAENPNKRMKMIENKGNINSCFLINGNMGVWLTDAGATCHTCSDKNNFLFLDSTWCKNVTVANGETERSADRGRCNSTII